LTPKGDCNLCVVCRLDEDGKVLTPEEILYRVCVTKCCSYSNASGSQQIRYCSAIVLKIHRQQKFFKYM
jgi:hypothetical protein